MRRVVLGYFALASLGAFPPESLRAQVCAGAASLRERSFRVSGAASNYSYATRISLSATAGRDVFGTVSLGRARDAELDASTVDFGLEAGADIANRERVLFLCPVAAVTVSLGPYDFLLEQRSYRYLERAVGLGLAAVAVQSRRLTVLVTGELRATWLTVTYWPSAAKRATGSLGWSGSDTYWIVSVGGGFVLDRVLTIRPSLTVPFGLVPPGATKAFVVPFGREDGEVSLGISVGVSLGRRAKQASEPTPPHP